MASEIKVLIAGPQSVHLSNFCRGMAEFIPGFDLIGEESFDLPGIRNMLICPFRSANPLQWILNFFRMRAFLSTHKPDVIHIHQANRLAFVLSLAAASCKTPIILTAWGSDVLVIPKKNWFYRRITRSILRRSNITTADSNEMIQAVQQLYPEGNYVRLQYGIDPIPATSKEKIIYSNRLHQKLYRIDLIIRLFADFVQKHPDWMLCVAGNGPETNYLKDLSDNLSISGKVQFMGWLDKISNEKMYARAMFYASIPDSDGTSVSLLEAMSAGCIPVVSDLAVSHEWIESGKNGIIMQADVNPFEQAIMLDAQQVIKYNNALIEQYALRKNTSKQFYQLYHEILGEDRQMKLLIITQYFPPEVGAPQNRLYELAVRLQKEGIEVEVLTAMPNYPAMEIHPGYRKKWYVNEKQGEIATHRSWIFVPKSKKVPARLLNYFSFVFSSFFIGWFKTNKPDLILCESPPLFLGISAWALAKIKGAKFIFNVSDLWPESAEKLGLVRNRFFLSISTRLEEFLYRNAVLITGQTQGIVQNIKSRFPQQQVHWLPNGVDLQFYNPAQYNQKWKHENGFSSEDFVLLYAGIIGHAQGLEVIIHAAAALRETPAIKFVLMGAGPEKAHLQALCTQLHLTSVQFFPPVTKEQMPAIIAASDAAIIPLKRLELFKGAIPSKIFEALAMEKPILLGVEGEAKSLFIESGDCGLAFVPEDVAELSQCILKLQSSPSLCKQLGTNGRKFVAAHFNRNQIASDFHKKLHEVFQHSIR